MAVSRGFVLLVLAVVRLLCSAVARLPRRHRQPFGRQGGNAGATRRSRSATRRLVATLAVLLLLATPNNPLLALVIAAIIPVALALLGSLIVAPLPFKASRTSSACQQAATLTSYQRLLPAPTLARTMRGALLVALIGLFALGGGQLLRLVAQQPGVNAGPANPIVNSSFSAGGGGWETYGPDPGCAAHPAVAWEQGVLYDPNGASHDGTGVSARLQSAEGGGCPPPANNRLTQVFAVPANTQAYLRFWYRGQAYKDNTVGCCAALMHPEVRRVDNNVPINLGFQADFFIPVTQPWTQAQSHLLNLPPGDYRITFGITSTNEAALIDQVELYAPDPPALGQVRTLLNPIGNAAFEHNEGVGVEWEPYYSAACAGQWGVEYSNESHGPLGGAGMLTGGGGGACPGQRHENFAQNFTLMVPNTGVLSHWYKAPGSQLGQARVQLILVDTGQLVYQSFPFADIAQPWAQDVSPLLTLPAGNYRLALDFWRYDSILLDDFDLGLLHDNCTCDTGHTANAGDPVNMVFGNFLFQQQDFALPGRGLAIDVARTYSSLHPVERGFGAGWSNPYGMTIRRETATSLVVESAVGREIRYIEGPPGTFTPRAGVFDTLVRNGDNTFTLTMHNQLVVRYEALNAAGVGRVTSMADRNGNTTTLAWATTGLANGTGGLTVTDPAGRSIALAYGTGANAARFVALTESGALARTVAYAYDAAGNLTSVTDVRGKVTTFAYDQYHRMLWVREPNGQPAGYKKITNEYDDWGRVIKQWDAKNRLITLAYNTTTKQTTRTDARGNATVYAYDNQLRITGVTDGAGHVASSVFDANFNRTSVTDMRGKTSTFTYDARGNALTATDPLGHTSTFTYSAGNDLLTVTVPVAAGQSRTTTFAYDVKGNPTSVTDPLGKVATITYAANGDLLTTTDPNAVALTYTYDSYGNRATATDGLGHTWTTTFDSGSRPTQAQDPLGHATNATYNAANQGLTVGVVLNGTTTLTTTATYDDNGNRTSTTDPLGHAWAYVYDQMNDLIGVTDPRGKTTAFAYNATGGRTSATDPTSRTTTWTYDQADRLTAVADNAGHTTTYTLDGNGNVVGLTDAESRATTYAYDDAGRLTSVTDALSHTIGYAYNFAHQLTGVTDANNRTTSYAYDGAGRPTGRTDPLAHSWTTAYDNGGRVASSTDANGHTTTYAYDAANRPTGLSYFDSTTVGYGYDNANRRTSLTDGTGTTTYGYDNANRLTSVTAPGTGTVGYAYDNASRRTGLTYPGGHALAYAYDNANRLTGSTDWLAGATTYAYDDAGRLTGSAYPNGVATTQSYDSAGRLTGVAHVKGATTLASVAYTLDNVGNRLASTETGVPLPGTTSYTYDPLHRLIAAAYPNSGTAAWGYDNVGNRTSVTLNGSTQIASYDNANRLTAQGATTYANDNNGNRTGQTTGGVATTYSYDPANRLVGVTGTTSIGYTYDGDGYRVGATSDPTDPTAYTWDRLGLGGLGQIIADDTGENVFGPAGMQQRVSGGAAQYAHGDGLGSLRLVTDASGAAAGSATYEPWGAPRSGSATLGGYGFTGELTDAETGFVYLRARYFDPGTGRFITQDTYPGTPGSPMSQHRFAYGNSNPLSYTDPSGHCPFCLVLPVGAVAAITVLLPFIAAAGISIAVVYICAKSPDCRKAIEQLADLARKGTAGCEAEIRNKLTTLFSKGQPVKPYEVGTFDDLKGRSAPGDNLDIHHIPQKHPAGQVIPGYNQQTGPAVALPASEHNAIPTRKGPYVGTPGELLEGDIDDLYEHTGAPPSVEDEIRALVEKNYPGVVK